jgi:hypothetical protein
MRPMIRRLAFPLAIELLALYAYHAAVLFARWLLARQGIKASRARIGPVGGTGKQYLSPPGDAPSDLSGSGGVSSF